MKVVFLLVMLIHFAHGQNYANVLAAVIEETFSESETHESLKCVNLFSPKNYNFILDTISYPIIRRTFLKSSITCALEIYIIDDLKLHNHTSSSVSFNQELV